MMRKIKYILIFLISAALLAATPVTFTPNVVRAEEYNCIVLDLEEKLFKERCSLVGRDGDGGGGDGSWGGIGLCPGSFVGGVCHLRGSDETIINEHRTTPGRGGGGDSNNGGSGTSKYPVDINGVGELIQPMAVEMAEGTMEVAVVVVVLGVPDNTHDRDSGGSGGGGGGGGSGSNDDGGSSSDNVGSSRSNGHSTPNSHPSSNLPPPPGAPTSPSINEPGDGGSGTSTGTGNGGSVTTGTHPTSTNAPCSLDSRNLYLCMNLRMGGQIPLNSCPPNSICA